MMHIDDNWQTARAQALELIIGGALHPDAWKTFLDHVCDVVGGASAALAIRSKHSKLELIDPVAATWPDDAIEAYMDHPREKDPVIIELTEAMFRSRNGSAFVTQELVDDGQYRKTSFYNEFAVKYDIPYLAGVAFDVGSEHFGTLMIYREDRACVVEVRERQFLESLISSLQMGLETRRRIRGASVAHGVLARLKTPVVALDESGHIDYANPAAETLLQHEDAVSVSGGRLCTNSPAITRELQAMCANAVRGNILKHGRELFLPRPDGQHPLRLLVLPLSYKLSDSLWGGDIPVAVFFFDSEQSEEAQDLIPILCALYGCTRAEAKNAILYAGGPTAVEVADMLGVKPETVKTHLKQVFQKLGVKNKSELAQRIQKLRDPVRRYNTVG